MKGFGNFYSFTIRGKAVEAKDIAKECLDVIPTSSEVLLFNIIHTNGIVHKAEGMIYPQRDYGFVEITKYDGTKYVYKIDGSILSPIA